MFRKYVIITLAAVLFLGTASCTSKKAESDGADVEAGIDDDESLESAEATEKSDDLSTEEGGSSEGGDGAVADLGGDELAPDEKLPDDGGKVAENSEVTSDDLSETPAPGASEGDQLAGNDEPAPPAATPEPSMSEPPPMDTAASEPPPPSTPEPEYDAPKPATMSLKKVAGQPWKAGKVLANAVYIVRDGDTAESISQKVFGNSDKVKELCRVNSYNCNRGLKVGDKMYYNSPQRPNDDTVVKTFYEDAGLAPQTYTAKAGDNIRKVGKELLGHERSWMELWATNDVESKGEVDEGTQLKYWPATETATPTQTMAANEAPPAPPAEGIPPADSSGMPPADAGMPPQDMNAMPPDAGAPPPQDMAAAPPDQMPSDLPPPPDQAAAGAIEPPPPPPPPPPVTDQASAEPGAEMQDPNQTMVLGVGAVLLLAAAALFISIRKKRQRRAIDFNTSTQTQIE